MAPAKQLLSAAAFAIGMLSVAQGNKHTALQWFHGQKLTLISILLLRQLDAHASGQMHLAAACISPLSRA